MKHQQLLFLLFNCSVCAFPGSYITADTPTSHERNVISNEYIDKVVNDALKAFNVPGAALGLVIDDQIILSKGYGTRRVNEDLPVTERTVFPLASVTKAFTALLLGQLVDKGILSYDDPVIKHVPELSLKDENATVNMTVRDLLAHRTGFVRHDTIWVCSSGDRSDVIRLFKHLEPVCALGEKFNYNNFSYALAGLVYERASGQSWEEAVSSLVLRPLGMNDSSATIDGLLTSTNHSFPHANINGITTSLPFMNPISINPGGGINSTVSDMIEWIKLQLSVKDYSPIICKKTLDEMQTMQIPLSPSNFNPLVQSGYGLGWVLGTYRDHTIVSHSGDIGGFATDVSLLPAERVGLVILTNSSTDGHSAITSIRGQLFDKILNEEDFPWLKEMESAQIKTRQELQAKLDEFDETIRCVDTPHSLEEYTGKYEHPAYGTYDISLENGSLIARYGSTSTLLYFKSENILTGKLNILLTFGISPVIDISFQRDSSGEICEVQVPFEAFRSLKPITFTSVRSLN